MALTALHADLGVLDVTEFVAGSPAEWWQVVHRTEAPLTCRSCRAPVDAVHAPSNRYRQFFFRHRAASGCWLSAGESEEHFQLKRHLAVLTRTVPGWSAEVEASGENWRADVLATGPGGRRLAWEVQLANSAIKDIQERSDRYAAAGVEVVWVTLRRTGWFGHVPALLLDPGENGNWTVVDGARALIRKPLGELHAVRPGRFEPPPKVEGDQVAQQRPAWTWRRLLAAGTVPDRLGPLTVPAWLWKGRRRGNVLWRAAHPVALDHVIWSVLAGTVIPVALDEPCVDIAKAPLKPVEVAWVLRKDAERAIPLVAFAKGWTIVPRDEPHDQCTKCGKSTLWLYGGPGWWVPACMGCQEDLYELMYQIAMAVEFDERFPAGEHRLRLDAPASKLVQPWRVRRRAPAPTQLVW